MHLFLPLTYSPTHSWERRLDSRGRDYFVDHNTRTTTWEVPTETAEYIRNFQQLHQQELYNLPEKNQQRFLNPSGGPDYSGDSGGEEWGECRA